jgi:hypothetical protein
VNRLRIDVQTASKKLLAAVLTHQTQFEGQKMKKVILAVLLTAVALFLILPNLSWAF